MIENNSQNNPQAIPTSLYKLTQNPKWTIKKFIFLIIFSLILACILISVYFYYFQYFLPNPKIIQEKTVIKTVFNKTYHNDYWGFKFIYPYNWVSVLGSSTEGDYYFASENLNFISETSENQAIMEIKPYINLNKLSFKNWVDEQKQYYFPNGKIISEKNTQVNNHQAIEFVIELKKPVNNKFYEKRIIISNNDERYYIFSLLVNNTENLQHFNKPFEDMLTSLEFYPGFDINK